MANKQLEENLAKSVAALEDVALMAKAHVGSYARKDGTMVREHDNGKDVGAGSWRIGHKVKLHAPGHKLHGLSGEIVGKGHKDGHVNVSSDNGVHSIHGSELRPADGHHWPDHETGEQRKK